MLMFLNVYCVLSTRELKVCRGSLSRRQMTICRKWCREENSKELIDRPWLFVSKNTYFAWKNTGARIIMLHIKRVCIESFLYPVSLNTW